METEKEITLAPLPPIRGAQEIDNSATKDHTLLASFVLHESVDELKVSLIYTGVQNAKETESKS